MVQPAPGFDEQGPRAFDPSERPIGVVESRSPRNSSDGFVTSLSPCPAISNTPISSVARTGS